MFVYVILGLFGGSIYAMAAMGVVLTYKTSGVFNFAYGGVAMFCAYVFWQMRDVWGWNQWISVPLLLLVVAPAVGLVLEGLFRLLAAASTDVQIVVALGVLALAEAGVPLMFGGSDHRLDSIFPPGHFKLTSQAAVTWNQLGTFLLAFVLAGLLYLLLERTRLGTATRAVVDNRDLAGLIGINAITVARTAWIVSTVFAAICGVLLSTQEGLVLYVLPLLVIYAFAPAVLGRLVSLPWAFAGALALVVIQNVLARWNTSGFIARLEGAIPYLALFILLVAYGSRLKELKSSLRPLSGAAVSRRGRADFGVGLAAAVLAAAVLPSISSSSTLHNLASSMAFAFVALTLVVLTGWTGQISIAQMSFAGIGAFTAAHIAGTHGALFPLAVLMGVLISIPVSLIIGLPSLRLSGLFLALMTMAFALLMDNLVFSDNSISGGLTGLSLAAAKIGPISLRSPEAQFYTCLLALTIAASVVYWLRRGPVGRRLQMVRDSPNAAVTLGANLTMTKLAVFAVGAAVASIGGALLTMTYSTADPTVYSFANSVELLILVVLGGRSLVSGALLAGALQLLNYPPIPNFVHKYFPLAIAFSVIAIAREPEGTLRIAARQTRYCLAVLFRRPRPEPDLQQLLDHSIPVAAVSRG